MKKIIFALVASTLFSVSGFASTPTLENENKITKENTTEVKKEVVCTTSCSRVIGGVTYTTSAGNWFSGCEGAANRCQNKLNKLEELQ